MKKLSAIALMVTVFCILSCQREEVTPPLAKGTLSVNIGLFISVNDVENTLKSTADAGDFKVTIHASGGDPVQVFEKASEMPEHIEMDPGTYYVTAHSDNDLPAAFSNPYYYGESALFEIVPAGQQTVSVNCQLANTMVTIFFSDQVKENFDDYSVTVSSAAGSLIFGRDETRPGYFRPLPLIITATLTLQQPSGTVQTKTLSGSIADPQPRKNYEIHVDVTSFGGSAAISILQDETIDPVEIIGLTDCEPGPVGYGDLLITEIMYDPSFLDDTEGEWFEIYNNTLFPIALDQVVIRKNSGAQHIINQQLTINSHEYAVFARNQLAVTDPDYLYNSSFSLNNSGGMLALYNYGSNGTNGSLICVVNYGGYSFPSATGASICLSDNALDNVSAVFGTSWCESSVLYNESDKGTPGSANGNCLP
ncbi:MAG: DUF4493 domain-containing protein [Bacteroidales bacterium]|nr:DUF4493 domain-containing protein [Bacteroidales bacterium]MBN2814302.1 DUF4493 domain-containing protein [Bacteroidales bacterium]